LCRTKCFEVRALDAGEIKAYIVAFQFAPHGRSRSGAWPPIGRQQQREIGGSECASPSSADCA
jgi:hypothetical protein